MSFVTGTTLIMLFVTLFLAHRGSNALEAHLRLRERRRHRTRHRPLSDLHDHVLQPGDEVSPHAGLARADALRGVRARASRSTSSTGCDVKLYPRRPPRQVSRWLERRVIAFAHQGGSFEGPSSTLGRDRPRARRRARRAIELDVHATQDRHVVVCHDATVDRTTNHHGEIAQLTLAELAEMDNAYWWIEGDDGHARARDECEYLHARSWRRRTARFAVATLEEVATAFPGVLLNLDIKAHRVPTSSRTRSCSASELRRLEITDSVIVASFHDEAHAAISRRSRPRWRPRRRPTRRRPSTSRISTARPSCHRSCALQVPATLRRGRRRRPSLRRGGPRRGHRGARLDDQRTSTRWPDCSTSGWTGSSATDRRRSPTLLSERDCAWDGHLAAALAAAAVRLFAVVGLLFGA